MKFVATLAKPLSNEELSEVLVLREYAEADKGSVEVTDTSFVFDSGEKVLVQNDFLILGEIVTMWLLDPTVTNILIVK